VSPFVAGLGQAPVHAHTRELVELYVDVVWRTLRRLGMPYADLDDGVQQVFTVLARRIDRVEPGKEKSFLLGVALRVVADHRRSRRRRHEVATSPQELDLEPALQISPELLLDQRRCCPSRQGSCASTRCAKLASGRQLESSQECCSASTARAPTLTACKPLSHRSDRRPPTVVAVRERQGSSFGAVRRGRVVRAGRFLRGALGFRHVA
jgi:DNA-directed RNA polymerase specialized sigma24 family protein